MLNGFKNQIKAMKPKRQLNKISVQDDRLLHLSTLPPSQSHTEIKGPSKHQRNASFQIVQGTNE